MTSRDSVGGLLTNEKSRYIEVASGVWAELVAIADGILTQTGGALDVSLGAEVEDSSLGTIDHAHRMTHEGHLYEVQDRAVHGSELANDDQLNILLTAGANAVHLIIHAALGGDAEVYLYKTPTTSSGTDATPINHREGGTTSTVTAKTGVTVSNPGTFRKYRFLPGGSGPRAAGGGDRPDEEFVIAAGETWLVQLFNRSGNAHMGHVSAVFYEEID